jgi:hypothetical protein
LIFWKFERREVSSSASSYVSTMLAYAIIDLSPRLVGDAFPGSP